MSSMAAESLKRQWYFQRDTTACPNHVLVSPNDWPMNDSAACAISLRRVSGGIQVWMLMWKVNKMFQFALLSSSSTNCPWPISQICILPCLLRLHQQPWTEELLSDIQFYPVFILKDQISKYINEYHVCMMMNMTYKLRFWDKRVHKKLNNFEQVHMDGLKISTYAPLVEFIEDCDVPHYNIWWKFKIVFLFMKIHRTMFTW